MAKSCVLKINLFDGLRKPISGSTNALITVHDGNQRQVYRDYSNGPSLTLTDLPFFDNFGDNYTVIAWAKGREQAGFTPVRVRPDAPGVVDIMLLNRKADFNFAPARWDLLQQAKPEVSKLLAAGTTDVGRARNRYTELMESNPAALACFFNLTTAMEQIHLPSATPLNYFRELIWDDTMQQDRFFAWADPALVDQVRRAAQQGEFAPEIGSVIFHKGATCSFKQVQFGEANLQLTFHEGDKKIVKGKECIKVEPDIDYYKDIAAHALLEVLKNKVGGALTDPCQVYVLRWIAGRHAGVPEFDPPYGIA